ncbi:MAG: hypothetical protein IJ043_01705 [Clostridia bacterium]|nr:hypothetical protein [Clostridia bacterium]
MVTRKTRWMSGLVAVLMLVSLFTAFCMPVSAAEGQTDLKSSTGLVDKTALPNIADGLVSGKTEYQVNSRAGFEKWAEIVAGGNEMADCTVWQTADVDMGWEPFSGIGGYADNGDTTTNPSSRATFDGNGFVITGLYIMKPTGKQVGFFNRTHKTTIRNMGIASGLVVGYNWVGSIIGYGNSADKLINCWSAATVLYYNGGDSAGGLCGRTAGAGVQLYNSYNLGMVVDPGHSSGGITGWINNTIDIQNCYNAGDIVSGFYHTGLFAAAYGADQVGAYTALVRANVKAAKSSTAKNNYYLAYENGVKSVKDAYTAGVTYTDGENAVAVANIDDGNAVSREEMAALASKLNAGDLSIGDTNGYTVQYVDTAAGYPALGYYNAAGELVVCRTAAEGASNVACNDWAEKSDFFKAVSDKRMGGFVGTEEDANANKLTGVTIDDANDLFAFGVISSGTNIMANMISDGVVNITADIDATSQTMVPGLKYSIPLSMNSAFTGGTLNGNYHVISNWKSYAVVAGSTPRGGFIGQINNATVKNLGMVNANSIYDYYYKSGYSYPTLMIEMVYGTGSVVENVFATGVVDILKSSAANFNNNSAVVSRTMGSTPSTDDGVPSLTMNNVWGESTINYHHNNAVYKGRALGSTKAEYGKGRSAVLNNVVYVADQAYLGGGDNTTHSVEIQPFVDKDITDGTMAAYLNDTTEGVYYTVKDGNTVFGTVDNATHTLTVNKKMENGTINGTDIYYYNTGTTVEIPVIAGYALDEDSLPETASQTTFDMPKENWELDYYVQGVDYSGVEAIADELAKYDFDLFNESETLQSMQDLVDATLAYKDQEQTADVIAAANTAITNTINVYNELNISAMTLKDAYPNVPTFSDYDVYKDWNPANWGIATKEDWVAATELSGNFSGKTIHLLADIDMENTNVKPLAYGSNFTGTMDGHGYVFENLNITREAVSGIGLISYLGSSAVVKNVGIASGAITVTYSGTEGVGAIAGYADGNAQVINCWNAASVTGTGLADFCVSGMIGRGYNGTVIDGCFNVGTITGVNHAAGLNDWAQDTGKIYNSFNAGELKASNGGLIRHNGNSGTNYHSNSYSLGYNFASDGHADRKAVLNAEPWTQMDTSIYSTGELAWMLNSNYTTGTKTYYTLKDSKTVFGTEDNQTIRVSLSAAGYDPEYLYVNAGETVTLAYADNAEYAIPAGSDSSLNGKELTAGKTDVTVTVTFAGYNYRPLEDAFAYYEARDLSLYADLDDIPLAELVEAVKTMKENNTFASQAQIDGYAGLLMSYELINEYPNLPRAKDYALYGNDAIGYLIKDVADLEAAGVNSTSFTADQTLYLEADLDLTDTSFVGFNKLYADFEGNNHTISNLAKTEESIGGLFRYYYGEKISNLILDNVHTMGSYGRALLVAELYGNGALTIENVHVKNSSVTATGVGQNAMGVLLSRTASAGGVVTVKDCTVTGTAMYTAEDYSGDLGNTGFIIGQMHNSRNFKITNVVVSECHMATRTTFATGIAFGCAEGAANVQMNNVAIINNKRTNSVNNWHTRGILIGTVKDGSLLDLDNVILLNNDQKSSNQYKVDSATDWNPAINMTTSDTVAMEGYSATNCFTDEGIFHNNSNQDNENGNKLLVTAADYGMIAYNINKTGVTMKWEITAEGELAVDTDNAGLPVAVTFSAIDEEATTIDVQPTTLYTNANGTLIGLTADLLNAAIWPEEETLTTKVFTEDTAIEGTPNPAHTHEWGNFTHIDGTNTHMAECTKGCGATATLDCTFDSVKHVEGTSGAESKHVASCECGNSKEVFCSENAETWTYEKVDATCSANGYEIFKCSACGLDELEVLTAEHIPGEWTHVDGTLTHAISCTVCSEPIEVAECTYDDAWTHVEGTDTHSRSCNVCGESTETEACSFTVWNETTAPQVGVPGEKTAYCDDACGNFKTEEIPALPEAAAFALEMPNRAKPGDTIEATVAIKNNPGVAGVTFDLVYDKAALSLVGAESAYGAVEFYNETGRVAFANAANVTTDEVLITLTFTVAEAAEGEIAVQLTPVSVIDEVNAPIDVLAATGKVTVSSSVLGDVTGDGRVSIADAVLMLRIASGDTELPEGTDLAAGNITTEGDTEGLTINTNDVVLLLKYLSGSVTEL